MGKGDKKSKKGKIAMGSYGKSRPHDVKKNKPTEAAVKAEKPAEPAAKAEKPEAAAKAEKPEAAAKAEKK
jgi:30S ribosomal protein S31